MAWKGEHHPASCFETLQMLKAGGLRDLRLRQDSFGKDRMASARA